MSFFRNLYYVLATTGGVLKKMKLDEPKTKETSGENGVNKKPPSDGNPLSNSGEPISEPTDASEPSVKSNNTTKDPEDPIDTSQHPVDHTDTSQHPVDASKHLEEEATTVDGKPGGKTGAAEKELPSEESGTERSRKN